MGRVKRIWYLSPMRAAKVQASLRIRAVSPEPPLLAHTGSESRGTFRQKARSLAPLTGWACAVKICHDGMLENTNSLDAAQMMQMQWQTVKANSEDPDQTSRAVRFVQAITILHGSRVWGADRKFHPEGHCMASRGFAEWCKILIPRDGIFYPQWTLMFDSFSCIPFHFQCFILKAAFIAIHNDAGIGHFEIWCHCDVAMTPT